MTSSSDDRSRTEATADETVTLGPGVPMPLPSSHIGPYRLVRYIGSGGMGTVYEAIDDEFEDRVAIKVLSRLDPWHLFRLKQEFRIVAGIHHDNLMRPEALFVVDGQAFVAMEYVVGADLRQTVRERPEWLRPCLSQLASGMHALHCAGVLHLDLKPSNVLVDAAGRVVILDFGLAQSVDAAPVGAANGRIAGTPGYIAPELLRGVAAAPASDWYAVGVILFMLLTGHPAPRRQRPSACCDDVPPDLDALCEALLAEDPADRPSGAEIVARLGAPPQPRGDGRPIPLVGRASEMAAIARAIVATRPGEPSLVRISGAPGVGKTRLVRAALEGLARADRALVLTGRCYECESVPYGGFDAVIDALARRLKATAGACHAADLRAAATVFPVLAALLGAPLVTDESPDRPAAFAAVRALFAVAAAARPVVLFIDDLHHAGADTAGLMLDLLLPRDDGLVLTLIATCRSEHDDDSVCLRELSARAAARGQRMSEQRLHLAALPPDACATLGRHHLEGATDARIRDLAQESGGNPFLIEILVREDMGTGATAVAELVRRRTQALPEDTRGLLAAVALSGQPLPQAVLLHAARVTGPRASLAALRALSLVRAQGTRRWDIIEPSHARIGEEVVAALAPERRTQLHGALARALERERWGTPELLARHWHGAGELARASAAAEQAASDAEQALAFERAAALLADAAAWTEAHDPGRAAALRGRQGQALVRAGRCGAAAEAFLVSAEHGPSDSRQPMLRRAADAWMAAGYVDRGLDLLRPMLAAEGLSWPRSLVSAGLALLWTYLRLRLRGVEIRPDAAPTASQLRRVDLCWSVGMGLTNVMPVEGMLFTVRALLAALRAGEPARVGRGLAVLGAFHRLIGSPEVGARYIDRARELATALADPQLLGLTHVCSAADAMIVGDWREVLVRTDRGLAALSAPSVGITWEQVLGACFALIALDQLGRLVEVERRASEHLRDAETRGDLYALVVFSQFFAQARLAAGDLTLARRHAHHGLERWTRRSYTVQHFYALRIDISCDLYSGDALGASARLDAAWRDIARGGLLSNPISRIDALLLRARCALARGDQRQALALARRLNAESRPDAALHARWIRARAAPHRAGAALELEAARRGFAAAGMELYAHAIGLLGPAPADMQLAIAELKARGVHDPERWQRAFLP